MLSHCCILFATQLIKDYWYLLLLKEVAALLTFDNLRSEGNRSLFKSENIRNLSKTWTFTTVVDLYQVYWSSFHRKIPLQFEVNEFEKKYPRKVHAVLTQYNRISFVLEACKFVKSFISLSLMSPLSTKAYTADTI